MINLFKGIKKKELTPKEELEREYNKKLKKLKFMALKNPIKFVEEFDKITDEMIEKGIYTQEEKSKNMEKSNRLLSKVNKLRR